jgi:hypothetical protein
VTGIHSHSPRGLRPALLWVAAVLAGCAGSGGEEAGADESGDPSGPISMELGAGELEFAPLSEDDELPFVAGAQGGHHVFVSFRVVNMDPKRMHVQVSTAVFEHPELDLTREGRVNFDADISAAGSAAEAPAYAYAGWPAQILKAPCHPGARVRIEVTLTDLRMQTATAQQTIRLATPDTPPPEACSDPD